MKKWILLPLLSLPIFLAGCAHRTVVVYAAPPQVQGPDEMAQRGYHDGFEAARRDVAEERRPDVKHHPRFENPPVPPPAIEAYRSGFKAGYNAFLHQGPPPQAPGY